MSLLHVENLTHRFGSLVALAGVSMTVEPGELRAVIGPNGAGKTTFFNLISGLFAPSQGRIRFDGQDVTTVAPHRRVKAGMARTSRSPRSPGADGAREPADRGRGRRRLAPAAAARTCRPPGGRRAGGRSPRAGRHG